MKLTPVSAAAAMVAAVLCIHFFGTLPAAIAVGVIVAAFMIHSLITKRAELVYLVLAAAFVFAGASYTFTTSRFMHPSVNYIGKDAEITGTIISNPQQSRASDNYKYALRVNGINIDDKTDSVRDTILLTTPERFRCGDTVSVTGTLKDFPSQMNENGFNTALWYKSQNISVRLYSDDVAITGEGFVLSPYFLSQKFSALIDSVIYKYYYGDTAALISAVLTGNTHSLSDEYYNTLQSTALKRQLHPAFIHIWIILALIGLARKIVKRKYRDASAVAILAVYAVFSCANIGFARCLVIAAMLIFARHRSGSASYRDMLAWIFIFSILTIPMILFNVTFIMSSVSGLVISQFRGPIAQRIRFVPRKLRQLTAVALIIAFILTPLSSVFFNGFCIYALITPIITIPLVLLIVIMSPIVFIMLWLFGTAPIIGSIYELALWLLLKLPGFIYRLPLSYISIPTPSPAALCLIVSLIFAAYYLLKKRETPFRLSCCISFGLLLWLCLSAILSIGRTDFIFVNVGQGDGAVIHTAYGATVLIDGGGGNSYSDYDPGKSLFVPYLESKGLCSIDAAFVSHFHKDHVQGVIAAINSLKVRKVFYMPPQDFEEDPQLWYAALKKAAAANGTALCPVTEDTKLSFSGGLTLWVYIPDKSLRYTGDENDSSLLIRAEYGKTSALYTGDMSNRAESEFMRRGAIVDSDILKVAHHGSASAASEDWIGAVSPDFAVISCGEDNTFGHPAEETLITLNHVQLLRTDMDGDIRITADKNGITGVSKFK